MPRKIGRSFITVKIKVKKLDEQQDTTDMSEVES